MFCFSIFGIRFSDLSFQKCILILVLFTEKGKNLSLLRREVASFPSVIPFFSPITPFCVEYDVLM